MEIKRVPWLTGIALLLLLIAGFGSCAAYYLPATEKVHLSGTEIKRQDAKDGTPMHDVRYIQATKLDGETLVFRNEDTRWGFPPYFKFTSADMASEAQAIAKSQPEAIVLVTYYGIRSRMLDLYPNAVGLRIVAANHVSVPIFNIVFSLVLVGLVIVIWLFLRRLVAKGQQRWRDFKAKRAK
jgi:hypothetical protein